MSITGIIIAALVIAVIGLLLGLFLGAAGEKFKVEVDEKEVAVRAELPGNNCGGCGYAGCDGLAAAIAKGKAEVSACPVGGDACAKKIGEIMGISAKESKPMTAFVKCAGTCDKTKQDYQYYGVEDCKMLSFVPNGGPKTCNYGCLGFGSCVKVCPFDAIHIVDGVAKVDSDRCKACKKCIAECPKNLIELVPKDSSHLVQCSSKDRGVDVMKGCSVGCIGCKLCEKICETGAITVVDNVAHIDPEKCNNCGKCAEKCPKKIIL
ncbi:MAG: RnfABCDGE type electron transport complex subunit B [Lachnospiraceae bacterium]|nr:RnfABCDGE type electron transport complex subunit B [Lachnospiraceae bacterium]